MKSCSGNKSSRKTVRPISHRSTSNKRPKFKAVSNRDYFQSTDHSKQKEDDNDDFDDEGFGDQESNDNQQEDESFCGSSLDFNDEGEDDDNYGGDLNDARSYEELPVSKNSCQIIEKYQENPDLRQHFNKISAKYKFENSSLNNQNFSFNQNYTFDESPTKNMKVLK